MSYIVYPQQNSSPQELGGKAKALADLHRTELPIPAWFVLTPAAFYASLNGDDLQLNPAVQTELTQALAQLCPNGERVAVRSSALAEDGPRHSFAGQLESFLFVHPEEVAEKVIAVWRSAFSDRILAYRRERGLTGPPTAPAVLIQRMIDADVAGVAFSADPLTGQRDVVVINAVQGVAAKLVSGEVDGETYTVDVKGKTLTPNGNTPPNPQSAFRIPHSQIQAIAALARRTEQFFGCPQDIEWAIEAEQLYLLQSRPITTLPSPPEPQPEGALNIWDNSNIAESYPGVTTPLTFSFARRAYEEVYRQFCRLLAVPADRITANDQTFKRMLGFIQGRIYYNLLNWYRVLALLPGYKMNRRFMEQMMGVKESLPDELLAEQTPPSRGDRWRDALHLARTVFGLIVNFIWLPHRIEAFNQRLNHALGQDRPDLSHWPADKLVAYYRDLESQLLTRWDAPLINDFFAMIFYGLLRKLTEKWAGDVQGTLQNGLLANAGGIISAEPAHRMRRMAHLAAADADFVSTLCAASLPTILATMPEHPEFESEYRAYLDKFGERCLEELKLESPTLHDDPLPLLRSIGQLVRATGSTPPQTKTLEAGREAQTEPHPEEQIRRALAGRPVRRFIFNWVLKNARMLIRNRENLRFERTRLFGRARMIFVALGQKLHALDLLADSRDIFYLEVEEALGYVGGTATTANLKELVALRKEEFERYQRMPPPPDRFETRGVVSTFNYKVSDSGTQTLSDSAVPELPSSQSAIRNPQSEILSGLGCSPGVVRGPVRVVTNPKSATLQPGEILVAQRTDPGWIMLFPAAAGLLVEHGSLLSHSAIVSRELGLPAIVSLKGVTAWLQDGDWVEFDGSTGVVRKVERAP